MRRPARSPAEAIAVIGCVAFLLAPTKETSLAALALYMMAGYNFLGLSYGALLNLTPAKLRATVLGVELVASNLFADILTDLGSAICGSLGIAPSANLNPERRYPSMFEPVHGSAPDIAGRGIANPIAAVWSAAMLLEFLGEQPASALIMRAIQSVTREGRVLTPDLGGAAGTGAVGDEIVGQMQKLHA
jgi:hypothetical protein